MSGNIPGSTNFDIMSAEYERTVEDRSWYFQLERKQDPPMELCEVMHLGTLAESIQPNTCQTLYGINPFVKGRAGVQQRREQQALTAQEGYSQWD